MRTLLAVLGGALALATAGCAGGTAPPMPVRGTVLYCGSPLRAGTIVFVPDPTRGGRGPLARADIRADGTFALQTDRGDGVPGGWYRVTVAAVAPADPGAVPRSLLPARYGDPELSGLECEVRPGQVNRFNFNLE